VISRRASHHRESIAAYVQRVERGERDELRALATELSVGETYFFRHVEQFSAYGELLAGMHRPVRVLSAGCSTGEEPYTLAIVAQERAVDPRTVTIEAIDFNSVSLSLAQNGVYSRWALRATTAEHEERWFKRQGRQAVLARSIVDAVAFSEANLLESATWQRPPLDFVFCRNVMMYFAPEAAAALVERLINALAPGGYLFLGHAETLRDYEHDLELCHTHGAFYHRRRTATRATVRVATPLGGSSGPPPDDNWFGEIAAASRRVRDLLDDARAAPKAPEAKLDAIRELVRHERFAEAKAGLDALGPALAAASDVSLLQAIIAAQTGEASTAREACARLLAAGDHVSSARYLLAICEDDPARSEQHAREALAADPGFAMASVHIALLARRRGGRTTAVDFLERAIAQLEREPEDELSMFAGGFTRDTLIDLCRSELAAVGGGR
jgi:chemotaxis protein methyltransferase CheR